MFRYLNKAEVIVFAVFFCIVLFWTVFGIMLIPTYFSLMFLSIAALFAILPVYIIRCGYLRYKHSEKSPMPDTTPAASEPVERDENKELMDAAMAEKARRKELELEWIYGGAMKELGFYHGGSTDSIRVHRYLPPELQKRVEDPDEEIRKSEITKLGCAVGECFITFLSPAPLANGTFSETLLVQWEKIFYNCIALRIQQHLEYLHLKNKTGSVRILILCAEDPEREAMRRFIKEHNLRNIDDTDSEEMRRFKERLNNLRNIYEDIALEVCPVNEDWKEKMQYKEREVETGEENIYTAHKSELMVRRISYRDTVTPTPEEEELGNFSWSIPCLGTAVKLARTLGFKDVTACTEYDASFYDYEDREEGFDGQYDSFEEMKEKIWGDYLNQVNDKNTYGEVVWDNLYLRMERGTQCLVIKCGGRTVRMYTSTPVMEELIPILPRQSEAGT